MILKEYKDLGQKSAFYSRNVTIDTKENFENLFADCDKEKGEYAFRGVSEAKYMMYSSGQRLWIGRKHLNSYYDFIQSLIRTVKKSQNLQTSFKKMGIDNEMSILCLLQHFGKPSPLIDFSYDVRTALFFAFDQMNYLLNAIGIDGYVSLYRINFSVASSITSFQKFEQHNAALLDYLMDDLKKNDIDLYKRTICSKYLQDTKELSYAQYGKNNERIVCFLHGEAIGNLRITIPALDFTNTYRFTNPRMISQQALFILNTSADIPLEKVIASQYCKNTPPIIECYNINKELKSYICENFLKDINKENIYPADADSLLIQKALDELLCGFKTSKFFYYIQHICPLRLLSYMRPH